MVDNVTPDLYQGRVGHDVSEGFCSCGGYHRPEDRIKVGTKTVLVGDKRLTVNQLSPESALTHLERIRRERELAQTFVRWNKSKEPQERAELWQEMFRMARELENSNNDLSSL